MPGSTSGAMAAVAAMEAARAAEEHRQACLAFMPTFVDRSSSVETKQSYAGCVETVYPQPLSAQEHHLWQICTMITIAFVVAGAFWAMGERRADWSDRVMGALVGLFVGPCLIGAFFFLRWVFL